MCMGLTATVSMAGIGAAAACVAAARGERFGIWGALGYFSIMETLQALGYLVVDQCGDPANKTLTLLSYLHITLQPFMINAFAMELVPEPVKARMRRVVYACCAAASAVMLLKLAPINWAGACAPGAALCGEAWCLRSGELHIAWDIPYNGLTRPLEDVITVISGFPTYVFAVFVLPLIYGAWRFVLLHAAVGPTVAYMLTDDPNEAPALWCLFSISILLIALSPLVRRRFEAKTWWGRPVSWSKAAT